MKQLIGRIRSLGRPRAAVCIVAAFLLACICFECVSPVVSVSEGAVQSKRNRNAIRKQQAAKKQAAEAPRFPKRKITINRVDPDTIGQVKKSAAEIDRLVAANYEKFQTKPNPLTSDEQFVRRIYLDITGAIPTFRQVDAFLTDRDADKRSELIDSLLNSWGYASHHYNYWGDVLRLTDELQPRLSATAYNEWIKQSLENNTPYDRLAFEMLTAYGKVWERPATGYVLRDAGMPLDNMSNTVRIFLGTQMGCAQCHNHPFDNWTQQQFYEMAAFSGSVATRLSPRSYGGQNKFADLKADFAKVESNTQSEQRFNALLRSNLYVVHDKPNVKLKYPHDYAYDNAKPGDVVVPKTVFGEPTPVKDKTSPREAFANWLTSPTNPRFAKTIANRLWAKCLGVGLIEPLDDIRDDSVAENEPLLAFLTAEMVRVGFDMKEYLRIVYNSNTYQREATAAEIDPSEAYHFPGPVLRRMSAEQVWDSFIVLALPNPEEFQKVPASVEAALLNVDISTAKAADVVKQMDEYGEKFSRRARTQLEKSHSYEGLLLARASELPTPTPPGHFLRQFGQSDRELISAASTDGSVPQALQMFNGPITHMLLDERSMMYKNVVARKERGEQIDVIFKSVLGRAASREESKVAGAEIQARGPAGYGNVIWALVNTREFLFIQ